MKHDPRTASHCVKKNRKRCDNSTARAANEEGQKQAIVYIVRWIAMSGYSAEFSRHIEQFSQTKSLR